MNIIQTNCAKMLNARKYNNVEIQEEENTITANDASGKNIMVLILEHYVWYILVYNVPALAEMARVQIKVVAQATPILADCTS